MKKTNSFYDSYKDLITSFLAPAVILAMIGIASLFWLSIKLLLIKLLF